MKISNFQIDIKYKFANKEKEQRIYLDQNSALIVRLDGKDITKNHQNINLFTSDFTEQLYKTSKYIMKKENLNCSIFSILDESSFVFQNGNNLFQKFDDSNQIYCSNIFLQWFLQEFWKIKKYKNVFFGISMFSLSSKDAEEYIKERKRIGELASLTYFAKEKTSPQYYHHKSKFEIKQNLQRLDVFDELLDNPHFLTGYIYEKPKENNYILLSKNALL